MVGQKSTPNGGILFRGVLRRGSLQAPEACIASQPALQTPVISKVLKMLPGDVLRTTRGVQTAGLQEGAGWLVGWPSGPRGLLGPGQSSLWSDREVGGGGGTPQIQQLLLAKLAGARLMLHLGGGQIVVKPSNKCTPS